MNKEVRPLEEYKEMIQNMSKDDMIKGLYDLSANIIEKSNKIERLNNIIKLKTDFIHDLLEIIYYSDDTPLHSKAHLIGEEYEDKLKELKEKSDI